MRLPPDDDKRPADSHADRCTDATGYLCRKRSRTGRAALAPARLSSGRPAPEAQREREIRGFPALSLDFLLEFAPSKNGLLAQLVEQWTLNPTVASSNLARPTRNDKGTASTVPFCFSPVHQRLVRYWANASICSSVRFLTVGPIHQDLVGEILRQFLHILIRQYNDRRRHHRVLALPFLESLDLAIEIFTGLACKAGIGAGSGVTVGAVSVRTIVAGVTANTTERAWRRKPAPQAGFFSPDAGTYNPVAN